ncbi:hypothetical protein GQ42DRAFT_168295 [Ramicandelaber brevisporus]|nr:hypothetical protein GQ42DRAFT_168295 [Ramicandelaber brevisporus]
MSNLARYSAFKKNTFKNSFNKYKLEMAKPAGQHKPQRDAAATTADEAEPQSVEISTAPTSAKSRKPSAGSGNGKKGKQFADNDFMMSLIDQLGDNVAQKATEKLERKRKVEALVEEREAKRAEKKASKPSRLEAAKEKIRTQKTSSKSKAISPAAATAATAKAASVSTSAKSAEPPKKKKAKKSVSFA